MNELIEKTRGPRARIIEGLAFYDGRAHSQRLRHYGDVPSSTYHFDKLEEQGIIERDGTEYVSQGGEAIVYQLTDFGYDVADELETPPDADAEMAEVKEAIRLLDKKIQANQDAIQSIKANEPDKTDKTDPEPEEPDPEPEEPDEPVSSRGRGREIPDEIPDDAPDWVTEWAEADPEPDSKESKEPKESDSDRPPGGWPGEAQNM